VKHWIALHNQASEITRLKSPNLAPRRKIFGRVPIAAGNAVQIAGLAAAFLAFAEARSASSTESAVVAMLVGWALLYFCCHAITHWAVGRIFGIRFAFYTIGGLGIQKAGPAVSGGYSSIFLFLECRRRKPPCELPTP
jgi:hypothetical protein